VPELNPDRKDTHWEKRKLKRARIAVEREALGPKPLAFSLNLFRSPQTYLRGAAPYPKRRPRSPQAGLSLFCRVKSCRLIGASEKVADAKLRPGGGLIPTPSWVFHNWPKISVRHVTRAWVDPKQA
jgi:hypothetical protein